MFLLGINNSVSCSQFNEVYTYFNTYLPPANEVCEGYVFTPVCQSFCSQGGEYLGRYPPGTRYPSDQVHPPWDQVHPLQDQVHPLRTRYTPQDQVHPPGTRYTPLGPGTPPPQAVHAGRYGQQVGGEHSTGMHSCVMNE